MDSRDKDYGFKRIEIVYLIDGVRVPKKTWEVRQVWGEHPSARFDKYEAKRQK